MGKAKHKSGQAARKQLQQDWSDLQTNPVQHMSLTDVKSYFRTNLQRNGTNVVQNDADPTGDGDQSRIPANYDQQFYRNMFSMGGDLNHLADVGLVPLSNFVKHCITGAVEEVEQALKQADTVVVVPAVNDDGNGATPSISPALTRLLETRETSLRLSPLMMLVSMGKNLAMPNSEHRQVQVAEILLRYGARPDAQDVCGKTVCHYGMGAMASSMTIQVTRMCLDAYPSSQFYGKVVRLHGFQSSPSTNGSRGLCKGYIAAKGRREVYLMDEGNTLSIKPDNLEFPDAVDDVATDGDRVAPPVTTVAQLCDIPDRLGAVCLHEVIQADRSDVANILLKTYHARMDIQDCDGMSPREMATSNAGLSKTTFVVSSSLGSETRRQQKVTEKMCSNCGKQLTPPINNCGKCKSVQYCGSKCQLSHWKEGGHKKVCKTISARSSLHIMLEKPTSRSDGGGYTTMSLGSGGSVNSSNYQKPRYATVNEMFDVKVQGGAATTPLMIYDKSREFNISVSPGKPGFEELLKAVQAEPTWQGRKAFVAASFDGEGNCTVYPGVTSMKKW